MTEQPNEQVENDVEPETDAGDNALSPDAAEDTGTSRQDRRDAHNRERLREVEAERDALRERLDARDRADVEAEARRVLGEAGAALFSFDVADLRDDDGNVDATKVTAALEPIRAALAEGRRAHHGDMGAKRNPPVSSKTTWSHVISRAR